MANMLRALFRINSSVTHISRAVMSKRTINPKFWNVGQLRQLEAALEQADAIGFDIDHTVAQYKLDSLHRAICADTADAVRKARSERSEYQQMSGTEFNKYKFNEYLQRGTLYDRETSTMLKLDSNYRIIHALRGSHVLTDDEIVKTYGEERIFEAAKRSFTDRIDNTSQVFVCDNFYDCIANFFFPQFVQIREEHEEARALPFDKEISAMFHVYAPANFAKEHGYFARIRNDTDLYLQHCSANVVNFLRAMKKRGKLVFLLTSSHADYAHLTLSSIFPPEEVGCRFIDLFDAVFCFARKPGFFDGNLPFLRVPTNAEGLPTCPDLHATDNNFEKVAPEHLFGGPSKVFIGGSATQLNEAFCKFFNKPSPPVLYFGDSLRSDLAPPKRALATRSNWKTCAIVPELLTSRNLVSAEQASQEECITQADEGDAAPHSSTLSALFGDFFGLEGPNGSDSLWWSLTKANSDVIVPTLEFAVARLRMDS